MAVEDAAAAEGKPRRYPDHPRVGVGAVVFDPMQRVLLVRRGNPPAQGQWGLPGGLLRLGESLQEGLHRELAEETGITSEIVDLLGLYEPIVRDEEGRVAYHYVVADYLCRWLEGEIRPGDDALAVAWASPLNLDSYDLTTAAKDMIAAARKRNRRSPAP